jgi:hypothetical protein
MCLRIRCSILRRSARSCPPGRQTRPPCKTSPRCGGCSARRRQWRSAIFATPSRALIGGRAAPCHLTEAGKAHRIDQSTTADRPALCGARTLSGGLELRRLRQHACHAASGRSEARRRGNGPRELVHAILATTPISYERRCNRHYSHSVPTADGLLRAPGGSESGSAVAGRASRGPPTRGHRNRRRTARS